MAFSLFDFFSVVPKGLLGGRVLLWCCKNLMGRRVPWTKIKAQKHVIRAAKLFEGFQHGETGQTGRIEDP